MLILLRTATVFLPFVFLGCSSIVTTPVKVASHLVVKPTKIVTKAALDIVEEPVKRTIKWAKPTRPLKIIP